jgi:hypothetical protein
VPAFSTKGEVFALLGPVRDAIQRLPVAGMTDMGAMNALERLEHAVGATTTVDPADAAGTARYRLIHGLGPLETEGNVTNA